MRFDWVKLWGPIAHERCKALASAGLPLRCIGFNVRTSEWCSLPDAHTGDCAAPPAEDAEHKGELK